MKIYNSTGDNQAKDEGVEVRDQRETIWLSQKLMVALFDCSTDNISLHFKKIFKENELDKNSATEDYRQLLLTAKPTIPSTTINATFAAPVSVRRCHKLGVY